MAKVFLTGGAGYIGSHAAYALAKQGHEVVIFDNLFRGYKQCVETLQKKFPGKISFTKGDLLDREEISKALDEAGEIDVVMHFAALCLVDESTKSPGLYFTNNVVGTSNLLEEMHRKGIDKLVFSSTCATYKVSGDGKTDEQTPVSPESPYGESKYLAERVISWYEKLHGLKAVRFRYFNVCGANSEGIIGDSKKPSQLLVQNAVRGALGIEEFKFTYGEVDTEDGSPVRDYINVEDLADAHVIAAEKLIAGEDISGLYNLGTGTGVSVKEAVEMVKKLTGKDFPTQKGEARKGEAAKIYADTTKAGQTLGWKPKRNIADSVNSLIKWYKNHPNGWEY